MVTDDGFFERQNDFFRYCVRSLLEFMYDLHKSRRLTPADCEFVRLIVEGFARFQKAIALERQHLQLLVAHLSKQA